MYKLKLILSSVFVVMTLNSWHNNNAIATNDVVSRQAGHFVSIDGLWISTPETSHTFSSGIFRYVFHFNLDHSGKLTARCVFLLNGKYSSEWRFVNTKYDELTRRITLLDEDGNTYEGILDLQNTKITGAIHLKKPMNDVEKTTTNLMRANKDLVVTLFYPYIPDLDGSINYSYQKPEQLDDGIQTASIYAEGVDSLSIIGLMKEIINQKYGRLESLLILKNDKLIVEEYFYGYNRTQLHNIHSCTKSVTSLLLGIALERHKNIDIDQSLFSFFPEYDDLKTEEKEQITLKHVLTMTAGFHDHKGPPEKDKPGDPFRYVLSKPLKTKPGETFKYSNESSDLLGGVIYSLEGKRADEFAKEYLFGSLGIHKYFWETENGITHCHSDLHLLPRDMAKIGLLVLNEGKWQKSQIVSKEWIRESTKPHVNESKFFDYGYQWWHRSGNNLQWWKEPNTVSPKEHDLITALGAGGQYIMIIRDLNLVVVTTASDYDIGKKARSKIPMVIEKVVPALLYTR